MHTHSHFKCLCLSTAPTFRLPALVAWRNWRATVTRILAPLVLLILALAIDESLKANDR
jgi:hypothetical protein